MAGPPAANDPPRAGAGGNILATYAWDTGFRVPARADGNNNTTVLDYNASNRPTCVTNPNGNKTGYSYDSKGNVTAAIDGQNTDEFCAVNTYGVQATITYNAANQPLIVTDANGHATCHGRITRP